MRILGFMIVLVSFCPPIFAQSLEDEEKEIRELWTLFGEYYASGDAEGVASLYAEDADRFAGIARKAVGREEILEQYTQELAGRAEEFDGGPFRPTEITIRFLRSDVAILDGISSPSATVRVYFTVIVTKEDGQWRLAAGRLRAAFRQSVDIGPRVAGSAIG